MKLSDFETLVRRLTEEVPEHFMEGISEISVSPAMLPHPVRSDVYTMGECIPDPLSDEAGSDIRSRIVLYHGSFQALAREDTGFDWDEEAFQTLTHELRHHLEWRARTDALEEFDRAAEDNFARHDGEAFDPLFFLGGEEVVPGIYQVDDDFFMDRVIGRLPGTIGFDWHGTHYEVDLPLGARLPLYLAVSGLLAPPPGELVIVLRRKPSLFDLFRQPETQAVQVAARPLIQ